MIAPVSVLPRRPAMVQLSRERLICLPNIGDLAQEFTRTNTIRLPRLLSAELMALLSARLRTGNWLTREHGTIGRELCLDDQVALHVLNFVSNRPDFLRLVERITCCAPIMSFSGRVYRMTPDADHYDSWHSDATSGRLIGMSVNLGERAYIGGTFRLRRNGVKTVISELPNTVSGDAILFRISEDLEHMVTPVEGTEAKTAYAGWFVSSGEGFFADLRKQR
jgi:hypothetical protein